ncbi:PilN domain-containing protein [Kiritimatiella glycovorans]|uniref:Type II secretory pathway, component PulL n=1 Tax=Kiritimatiella glycovorans TaxID=1307763 RepID=A0A0G3EGR4_9BACT|nr:PilN domain-containing protein [Kiritimatiella glycovorans]AKJ64000.1 Type II secretory pathway, component PulL [Kiritimatiella glycovorans]
MQLRTRTIRSVVASGGTEVDGAVLRRTRDGEVSLDVGHASAVEELAAEARANDEWVAVLGSREVFLRIVDLPSTEDDELAGMAELQLDATCPFPAAQLYYDYEVLERRERSTRAAVAAVRRDRIDRCLEEYRERGSWLCGMDVAVLAWWSMIRPRVSLPDEGVSTVLMFEGGGVDMLLCSEGSPVALRVLDGPEGEDDESRAARLARELEYTLASLESDLGELPGPARIEVWSGAEEESLAAALAKRTGAEAVYRDTGELEPLAAAVARRAEAGRGVNLVPEAPRRQRRERIGRRRFYKATAALAGIWAALLLSGWVAWELRQSAVEELRAKAESMAAPAEEAREIQRRIRSMEQFGDRSRSALECLREVSGLLPEGVELSAYHYRKNRALALRGSGPDDQTVYEFFERLATTELFAELRDQRVMTERREGKRVSQFSVTAVLEDEA